MNPQDPKLDSLPQMVAARNAGSVLRVPRGVAHWRRQMQILGLDEAAWTSLRNLDGWLKERFREAADWFQETLSRTSDGGFPMWEVTRRDSRFRELFVQYLDGLLGAEDVDSYLHHRRRLAETHLAHGVPAAWWMHGHRLVLAFLIERLVRRQMMRPRRLTRQLIALEKLFGLDEQIWRELHALAPDTGGSDGPDFVRKHGFQDVAFQSSRQVETIRDCHGQVVELRSAAAQGTNRLNELREVIRQAVDEVQGTRAMIQEDLDELDALRRHIETLAEQVRSLEEQSHEIEEVIATAKTLSYRSKVVSINATIEAARAGEAGRGFEVVSHEMGRLARKSHEATVQIEEILTQLLQTTGLAADAVYSGERVTDQVVTLAQSIHRSLDSLGEQGQAAREGFSSVQSLSDRVGEQLERLESTLEQLETSAQGSLVTLQDVIEKS